MLKSKAMRTWVGTMLTAGIASCVPLRDDSASHPPTDSDLAVQALTSAAVSLEGATVRLTAIASGGSPPYFYYWDVNDAPADPPPTISDPSDSSVRPSALSETGRYVFRVAVTDSSDVRVVDYVAVEVQEAALATIEPLIVVGQETALTAAAPEGAEQAEFLWDVVSGDAVIADPIRASTTLVAGTAETVVVRLTVTTNFPGSDSVTTSSDYELAAVDDLSPRVLVETTVGDFTIELFGEDAPGHVANLLLYVDDGFYDGLLFHRAVCSPAGQEDCQPFVIQGGGYRREGEELVKVDPTRDPIESEADNGLSNGELYSVALALTSGDADSGTTQFFVNLDTENDSLDEQDFTVFGSVVEGRDVVDEIVRVETELSTIINGEVSQPTTDVTIRAVTRVGEE
jgi:cyclophilin family peptidyl-prolyl cis-trans isomerase